MTHGRGPGGLGLGGGVRFLGGGPGGVLAKEDKGDQDHKRNPDDQAKLGIVGHRTTTAICGVRRTAVRKYAPPLPAAQHCGPILEKKDR